MEIRANSKGKRWGFCVTHKPFYGDIALGNGTQWKIAAFFVPLAKMFIGVETRGCYTFCGFVHYSYAMEKLNIGEPDARNLSDWINCQLSINDTDYKEQGNYEKNLISEGEPNDK